MQFLIVLFIIFQPAASDSVLTNPESFTSITDFLKDFTDTFKTFQNVIKILFISEIIIDILFVYQISRDINELFNSSSINKSILKLEANNNKLQNQLNSLSKRIYHLENSSKTEIALDHSPSSNKQTAKILQERK